MSKPLLSIGMIFKNEIRCLERSLKSLQPLRDAIPCELVMADTGSDDGSREIAEKYADILFDFPWINDFSAARNAVMDRCSGAWYFSVDADEWLDEDIEELTIFLQRSEIEPYDAAGVREYNYYSTDPNGGYAVFTAQRLLRMSTGIRYQNPIHEVWPLSGHERVSLLHTVLYHDGYVNLSGEAGREKRARNLGPLRERLRKYPNDLGIRVQMIESDVGEADYLKQVRRAVALLRKRPLGWEFHGPAIMRYAVSAALDEDLPEMEEWLELAEKWFPDSYCTRIDASFIATIYYYQKENYESCVRWAEIYLKGLADFNAGKNVCAEQLRAALKRGSPTSESSVRILLGRSYYEIGNMEQAENVITAIDYGSLDMYWTANLLMLQQLLHFRTGINTVPLIIAFWDGISAPVPSEEYARQRVVQFLETGSRVFGPKYHEEEDLEHFQRRTYTLFPPLRGKCELGNAAAALDAASVPEAEDILRSVEKWDEFPIFALLDLLERGVRLPLPGKQINIEQMDSLASRLANGGERLFTLAVHTAEQTGSEDRQGLCWARGLLLAAVREYPWNKEGRDAGQGMALARSFAKTEKKFLRQCYVPEILQEDTLFILPPMHRFGWYCVRAFDALDAGDAAGYVRFLREGLAVCESMRDMTQFLLEHTPELHRPEPSAELNALAEQIRSVLSSFAVDDPAVASLKQSEAYRKVAHLIEGMEAAAAEGQRSVSQKT